MTNIGIDTRSILPRRTVSVPMLSATDRVRVMESRARRGDAQAIAWMAEYRQSKERMWA